MPPPSNRRKGFAFRFNRGLLLTSFWDCYRVGAVPNLYIYVHTYKHTRVDMHEFCHRISSNHEVVLGGAVRSLGPSNTRLDRWVLDLADSGHDRCKVLETINLLHRVPLPKTSLNIHEPRGCCQRSSER